MVQVGLGNKDWYVITGLPEIKQFCMAEDSLSHLPSKVYTDKKENQIFLIYKEIQKGSVAKLHMTNGFVIYG